MHLLINLKTNGMKKIMFNDKYGLTKVVLDKIKTQTRRIIKAKNLFDTDEIEDYTVFGNEVQIIANNGESLITIKSKYEVGEVVAVAQSYNKIADELRAHQCAMLSLTKSWTNKMFSRPDLMPHQIRITSLHIERLQDISEDDCMKEGINKIVPEDGIPRYRVMDRNGERMYSTDNYKDAYRFLINGTSGKGTWEKNPYVWVYDFELVK